MATVYNVVSATSSPTAGMGANILPDGSGVSFRVWAPNAGAVQLEIRKDDSEPIQQFALGQDPSNNAYWSVVIGGAGAGHQYRFLITNIGGGGLNPGGLCDRVDPYCRDVESSDAAAPAYVVQPATPADFVPFQTPYWENFLIYQLHVGSFAGLNDDIDVVNRIATFRQIADNKLQYIADMKFNAVQFMPTTQNPPKEPEGYAPTNYFSPDADYGDPVDLVYLVQQCHNHGLAVLFDVVYNHATAQSAEDRLLQFDGNLVNEGRGIYFSINDNFGPVPDFDRPDIRSFFADNGRQCFREFGADGLRFDSAHAINGILRGYSVLQDILGAIKADFPSKFPIAEHNNPSFAVGTLGFGASWAMDSADNFVNALIDWPLASIVPLFDRNGMPNAFNLVRYLLGSHDQIYADYTETGGQITTDKPNNRYFVERIGGVMVGRNDWTARAQARMGWAANIAIPCTPMMFMGTECHHWGYWDANVDAYGEHRFDWDLTRDAIGTQMISCVTDANQMRWDNPALRSDSFLVTHFDPQNRILGFKRWNDEGNVILAVVNMSDNQWNDSVYGLNLGGDLSGSWVEIFNSQSQQYGGWADSGNEGAVLTAASDGNIYIRLPKWATLVFRKQ